MTKEDKGLLLKDLSARLPYDTIVSVAEGGVDGIKWNKVTLNFYLLHQIEEEDGWEFVKPYLRPMSSMTEEEKHELLKFGVVNLDKDNNAIDVCCVGFENHAKVQDYLNSIHVDYRGLIPMGLALEATEGMYKIK